MPSFDDVMKRGKSVGSFRATREVFGRLPRIGKGSYCEPTSIPKAIRPLLGDIPHHVFPVDSPIREV